MQKIITGLIALLVGCAGCNPPAYASDAMYVIHAIIGEAADQSMYGQIAVACGIRNRPEGLQGVEGTSMGRVVTKKEFFDASLAYKLAEEPYTCEDFIHGADMWCSDYDQCRASWAGVPMVYITTIGDHHFFRRITTRGK